MTKVEMVPGSTFILTEDGDPVLMPGLFAMYDTHGLPFEFSFTMCLERGMYPDWVALVRDARKAGWGAKKTLTTVGEAIRDVFGPNDSPAVMSRFTTLVEVIYGQDACQ